MGFRLAFARCTVHVVYLHACIGNFFPLKYHDTSLPPGMYRDIFPEVTWPSREYAEYTISGAFEVMASHGTMSNIPLIDAIPCHAFNCLIALCNHLIPWGWLFMLGLYFMLFMLCVQTGHYIYITITCLYNNWCWESINNYLHRFYIGYFCQHIIYTPVVTYCEF